MHQATTTGDYAMVTIEKVRLEMQETIEAKSKELAVLRSDNKKYLLKIHEQTLYIDTLTAESLSSQSFLNKAKAKVQELTSLKKGQP